MIIQRRLKDFLNFQHFPVKQRNWGKKRGLGMTPFGNLSHVVTFHRIQLLLLEKFWKFQESCKVHFGISFQMILLGVEKLREILSFCSVVMSFMLLQNIAPEKMGGFPRLVFDVSTRCWYKLFVLSRTPWSTGERTARDYIHVPQENIKLLMY